MYPFGDVKCVDRPPRDWNQLEVNLSECKNTDSGSVNGSEVKVKDVSMSTSSDVCGVDSPLELTCELKMCAEEESSELMPELTRTWDYEETGYQITDVQGRLNANVEFWEQKLQAPFPVLSWIKQGYKLPLLSLPEPFVMENHKLALESNEFVNSALSNLVSNRCVLKVNGVPQTCSPLSVVTNGLGKKRLVIDLRYLNGYLLKEKFKYEDLRL